MAMFLTVQNICSHGANHTFHKFFTLLYGTSESSLPSYKLASSYRKSWECNCRINKLISWRIHSSLCVSRIYKQDITAIKLKQPL